MKHPITLVTALFLAIAPAPAAAGIADECGNAPTAGCVLEAAAREASKADSSNSPNYVVAMSDIGAAHAKLGRRDVAFGFFEKALNARGKPELVRYVVLAMIESGEYDEAFDLARQMPGQAWRNQMLSQTARAWATAGFPDDGAGVARIIDVPWLRTSTLTEIAKTVLDGGAGMDAVWPRFEEALKSAEKIDSGFESAGAVATVARMLVEAGELERAAQLKQRMDNEDMIDRVTGHIGIARAKAGDMAGAVALAKTMNLPQSHANYLGELSVVAAEAGDPAMAKKLDRQALAAAKAIKDRESRQGALIGVAESRGMAGNFEGMLAINAMIGNPEWRDGVLDRVLKARIAAGDFAGLGGFAPHFSRDYGPATAYQLIGLGLIEAGDQAGGRRNLTKSWALIEKEEPDFLRNMVATDLAESWAKAGDFELALRIAETVADEGLRNGTLASIAIIRFSTGAAPALAIVDRLGTPYARAIALKDMALVAAGKSP